VFSVLQGSAEVRWKNIAFFNCLLS